MDEGLYRSPKSREESGGYVPGWQQQRMRLHELNKDIRLERREPHVTETERKRRDRAFTGTRKGGSSGMTKTRHLDCL